MSRTVSHPEDLSEAVVAAIVAVLLQHLRHREQPPVSAWQQSGRVAVTWRGVHRWGR